MSGEAVWDAHLEGRSEDIRNYCETDVINTYLVYLRFELMRGRLNPEEHDRECAHRARVARVRGQGAPVRVRRGVAGRLSMKRISAAPEEADVVDLSHEGRGVAKLDGKAVFVPDALPGERVVLRRVGRGRNFDEAVLEQVLRASPDRVPAECPHFGLCGGCALQHLAPSAQLAFKQSQLLESLVRLGGVEPASVLEPLTGPVWGYRRRARLGIKLVPRKGRVLVGFRERSCALRRGPARMPRSRPSRRQR